MAYSDKGKSITLKIIESTAGRIFCGIAVSPSGDFTGTIAGAGDTIIGYLQREGIPGEALPVMVDGISFAVAAAPIAPGDGVAIAADGRVTSTSGGTAGMALSRATAAGDLISVFR